MTKFDDETVKRVVDRFLSWPLPNDFNPDGGVVFTPSGYGWPVGTNLLTATQAEAMVRHILGSGE